MRTELGSCFLFVSGVCESISSHALVRLSFLLGSIQLYVCVTSCTMIFFRLLGPDVLGLRQA